MDISHESAQHQRDQGRQPRPAQQNDSLEAHIAELEEQLATAEEDKKALDETVGVQSNQLRALDWLLEIENAYNTGDLDAAKDNIRSFEETGTVEFLPKEPLRTGITGDDAPSPAARYQSIVDKLFPDGVKQEVKWLFTLQR